MKYNLIYKEDVSFEQISELFHVVWEKQTYTQISSKTKWAFDNDFSKILLYESQGEVIAVRGGIYWPLRSPGKEIKVIQFHGTCVHPNYRRKGIFTSINKSFLEEAQVDNVDLIFNVSVDNSRAGYEKLGWKYYNGFRRLTYINKPFKRILGNNIKSCKITDLPKHSDTKTAIPVEYIQARNNKLKKFTFCEYTPEFLEWRLNNSSEGYQIIKNDEALVIYKVKINNNRKEVIIGECFLLDYNFKSFSRIINFLVKVETPDIIYTYIFKDHPCYSYFLRKLFLPNPKRLNLNFGVRFLNDKIRSDIENSKWSICYLDIDTF